MDVTPTTTAETPRAAAPLSAAGPEGAILPYEESLPRGPATATSPSPGEAAASSSVVPMVSSDTGASTSVVGVEGALEGDDEGDGEEAAAARPRTAKNTRPNTTKTFWRPILLCSLLQRRFLLIYFRI
ncbi:hypothetical protein YC2023_096472 [Brassica napus]